MYFKIGILLKTTALALTLAAGVSVRAQDGEGEESLFRWPEGQLLPSFPASAEVQDHIYLNDSNGDAEMYLFSSLKGLVNRRQPRIFSYEGDDFAEGPFTWLSSLGVKYNTTTPWAVLEKYKSEISGLILYDPAQLHTVNLAGTLAKDLNALVASPTLHARLTSPPFSFPVLADLRAAKFSSALQVYQYMFDSCWVNPGKHIDKRLLIGLSPEFHKAALREYAVALGAVMVWLDPKVASESALLNRFLEQMPAGANYMGWWPEEEPGVTRLSAYGFTTIASDYCTNLTFHSGLSRAIYVRPTPAKPALENKVYVAFIISDGDNLQYVEHRMRRFWDNPNRGAVPIGWTISPAMVDAMPGALSYFHRSSTDNDNLISGPSGYGYTYPNNWVASLSDALANFAAKTEAYNVAAGLRVITVWNTITGGISQSVGNIFAENAPTLLGLTAQNTGGAQSIYANKLPGKPLSCNYCTGVQAMKDHIDRYSGSWNAAAPLFLIIQGNPWNSEINPTGFKEVKEYYSTGQHAGKYVFVRPDHLFQLLREHNGLAVNPGGVEGKGEGLTAAYFNGVNFEAEVVRRVDPAVNFEWGLRAAAEDVNAENFSVRWEGKVMPRYSEPYTFYLTCDKGGRLWVNNQLVIDSWSGNQETSAGTIALAAGQKYDLKLEYYDDRAMARCRLEWASGFQSREVVPKSQLFKDAPTSIVAYVNAFPQVKVYASQSEKGFVNVEVGSGNGVGGDGGDGGIGGIGDGDGDVSLTVYDICGRVVLRQAHGAAKQQLDLSRCPKGIYLFLVSTKKFTKTLKYFH